MKKALGAVFIALLLVACTELDDMAAATGSALTKTAEVIKNPKEPAPAAVAVVKEETPPPAPRRDNVKIVWVTPPAAEPHPFDQGEEEPQAAAPAPVTSPEEVRTAAAPIAYLPLPPALPAPVQYTPEHKPMIAIVIDDMGLDVKRSAWAADLPGAITLSYLPYAPRVGEQAQAAAANGHEIMLHMPMQPQRKGGNPGRYGLMTEMTDEDIRANTNAALDAFSGYAGVNNHMGSKFTSSRPGMDVFMDELKKRGVFFLDSKTSPASVAEKSARAHGLPATRRDVFIDHIETAEFVAAALNHAEDIARATGSAVAIGHPKDVTLASLEAWMEGLEDRGFQIVPMSQIIDYRSKSGAQVAQGFTHE